MPSGKCFEAQLGGEFGPGSPDRPPALRLGSHIYLKHGSKIYIQYHAHAIMAEAIDRNAEGKFISLREPAHH
jgi:hypothetical protein